MPGASYEEARRAFAAFLERCAQRRSLRWACSACLELRRQLVPLCGVAVSADPACRVFNICERCVVTLGTPPLAQFGYIILRVTPPLDAEDRSLGV